MTATRIATTTARDLQPLGIGGRRAIDAAGALGALLRQRLSPEHAALFADPQANPVRAETDWYAEGTGPAVPLTDLPPEHAAPVRAILDRLVGDILAEIARLRTAPGEGERFLAEMLDLAIRIPDDTAIRVRGGRPVLVAWGHQHAGAVASATVLGRTRTPAAPMAILPPPVSRPAGRQRSWLWLVALFGSILLFGLAAWYGWTARSEIRLACHIDPAGPAALAAWRNADAANSALRAQLAAMLDQAGRRRLHCPPAPAAAAPPALRDLDRVKALGGHSGKLQITLAWDDANDLDLHVICPGGQELFFGKPRACGGILDVDANAKPETASQTPVENASWDAPPPGNYAISVVPFKMRAAPQSAFRVTVRQDGLPDRVVEGRATPGESINPLLTITVAGGAAP